MMGHDQLGVRRYSTRHSVHTIARWRVVISSRRGTESWRPHTCSALLPPMAPTRGAEDDQAQPSGQGHLPSGLGSHASNRTLHQVRSGGADQALSGSSRGRRDHVGHLERSVDRRRFRKDDTPSSAHEGGARCQLASSLLEGPVDGSLRPERLLEASATLAAGERPQGAPGS